MEKKFPIFKTLTLLVWLMLGMGTAFADDPKCAANTTWGEFKTEIADLVDGYYQIDSPEKLAWFACETSKGSYTIKAKLTQSIDLEHKLFMPIAAGPGSNGDTGFKGEFDGQGFKISNLYINASEIAKPDFGGQKNYAQNVGFVAVMGVNATVKNITLENVDIQASTNAGEAIDGQEHQISVGAVVGWMAEKDNILVENCMVSGIIKTTGNKQGVGGIVGNAKKGTITNCLSLVEIQASGSQADIGGIIGITKKNVTVSSCVYAGPGLTNTGSNGSVGGIAGNVIFGTLTTEGDYYEGQSLDGVGNYCADCKLNGVDANPDNNIQQVTLSNIEEVTCELNGKNTDGTCKTEPWAVGETSLSLNGYGIDGYKIVFYANGGEYADGSDAKNKFFDIGTAINADDIVSPSDEENTFMGWALDRNATAPAENLGTVSKSDTVFAVWQPKLTLTFDVSPGVFPDDNVQVKTKRVDKGGLVTVGSLGTLPTSYCAEKSGDECIDLRYFTGWATNADPLESDTIHLDDFTTEDDLTLYAVWTVDTTYTVTYNANGHGKTRVDYVRVKNGKTIEHPQDPVAHDGYVFADWFTNASCGEGSEFDFGTPITESIVLYAKWNPQTYTITYDIGDGVNAEGNPSEYNIEEETIYLKAPTPAEGKSFEGWYNDRAFSKKVTKIAKGSFGNKTFYAKWSTKTYRIRYWADNNTYGAITDQFKEHGKSVVLESDGHFSRTGYSQDGWSLTDGGERVYALGASYSANADINLYPHWVQGLEVEHYGAVTVYKYTNETVAEINGEYTGADAVNIPTPIEVDRIVINRTFTSKSTIMLPFTLPPEATINGAKFYDLKSVVQAKGKYAWKATMQWIGSGALPEANKPYGIICSNSTFEFNLNGKKATLEPAQTDESNSNSIYYEVSGGNWRFVGVYAIKNWKSGDGELDEGLAYALAGAAGNGLRAGDFGKVTFENWTYPMRAYMRKRDENVRLQSVDGLQTVRARGASYGLNNIGSEIIEVEFVDDEKTTAIGHMNTVTGEIKIDRWFDLKGRHVKNVNRAAKGAYYGKKVFHE